VIPGEDGNKKCFRIPKTNSTNKESNMNAIAINYKLPRSSQIARLSNKTKPIKGLPKPEWMLEKYLLLLTEMLHPMALEVFMRVSRVAIDPRRSYHIRCIAEHALIIHNQNLWFKN
jgi:hypothetical protein